MAHLEVYTQKDVYDVANIVTALNDVHGLDLGERDRRRVEQLVEDVKQDESVQAVTTGPNSKSNKRHHANNVADKHTQAQGAGQKSSSPTGGACARAGSGRPRAAPYREACS